MKLLLIPLLASSCTSLSWEEAGRFVMPNYAEVSYDTEGDRPDGWNTDTIGFTLGWQLQAQPVRITSSGRTANGGDIEPIPVVQPALVQQLAENQVELQDLQKQTLLDQVGQRETIAGGAAALLVGLLTVLRHFGLLGGRPKESGEAEA